MQSYSLPGKVCHMLSPSDAEEHLRIIRSLMERATVYRAVSASGALAGGLLAVAAAAIGIRFADPNIPTEAEIPRFFLLWLAVFIVTSILNLWLLARDAGKNGGPWFSERMQTALRCMAPALLAGASCAILQSALEWSTIASLWVLLYGVSLLSMRHFAPKSVNILGWTFLITGTALLVAGAFIAANIQAGDANPLALAHGIMGGTFGLFHIVYALCVWPRRAHV